MPRSMTLLACFLTPALLLSACGESEEVKALRANHAQLQTELESTKSELSAAKTELATSKQEGERLTGELRNSLEAAQTELASTKQALERATTEASSLRTSTILEVRQPSGTLIRREPLRINRFTAVRHGIVDFRRPDGGERVRLRYTQGKLDDQQVTIYGNDGKPYLEGPIVGGWLSGLWTQYTEGRPSARLSFRQGQLTDLEVRDDWGNWASVQGDDFAASEQQYRLVFGMFLRDALAD